MYTDGSKQDTSLTAAVVQPAMHRAWARRVQGHDGQLNTPLRGELAAIYIALDELPVDANVIIMTDSLTSLQLISAMRTRPEALRYHKHQHILTRLAQLLQVRTGDTNMHKVKAHIGVCGNRAADALAAEAHNSDMPNWCQAPDAGHGPNWPRYKVTVNEAPEWWIFDNLGDMYANTPTTWT